MSAALLAAAAENPSSNPYAMAAKTAGSGSLPNGLNGIVNGLPNKPNGLLPTTDAKRDKKQSVVALPGRGKPVPPDKNAAPNGGADAVGEGSDDETILSAIQDLFLKIVSQKKRTGTIAPTQFVNKLKKENELFRSSQHQDAHEFLNYTLNAIGEILVRQQNEFREKIKSASDGKVNDTPGMASSTEDERSTKSAPKTPSSWVHELFEGLLTNETKCLTCETVTDRDEAFLDLSIDVEQHSSLTACLRNFSSSETLCHRNKFFCDTCGSLQEAEKRMKVKKLPNVLSVHLKRFKYQEKLQRYVKLGYRVVFPMELRLFNTADDTPDPDRLYNLFAIIVHIGSGPYHGHYIAVVKSQEQWLKYDDDSVEPIEEVELAQYFGESNTSGCGYIFFYQAADYDVSKTVKIMRTNEDGTSSSTQNVDSYDTESTMMGGGNHSNINSPLAPSIPPTPASFASSSSTLIPPLNLGPSPLPSNILPPTNPPITTPPPPLPNPTAAQNLIGSMRKRSKVLTKNGMVDDSSSILTSSTSSSTNPIPDSSTESGSMNGGANGNNSKEGWGSWFAKRDSKTGKQLSASGTTSK
ncbi:hypothetical protein SmJEL517_g05728 [Synchytrium microbalum]|uniref:ubiquitinyl hydrolase 1 n=1 Tax=Synchytrium microbalum TaxID=1806994 RepID=A0A507BZW0_9FUNG|nr:uncharacterized protein SmJEL517_g05728 [Synchytrium microbalum]TPX30803.1 hypothetical protein SmJEL517_g05728 [Synchytrium microbalum]